MSEKIQPKNRLNFITMKIGLVKAEAPKVGHLSANTAGGMTVGPIEVVSHISARVTGRAAGTGVQVHHPRKQGEDKAPPRCGLASENLKIKGPFSETTGAVPNGRVCRAS